MSGIVPLSLIEHLIYVVRGQRVMLDSDLAKLYGVATFNLNKAVQRNKIRFPEDFLFQLTKEEWDSLRFQIGILKTGRGQHRKYLPHVFTRDGVSMLSSVLRSERAALVNIGIMRAFGRMGDLMATHKELARKLDQLERKVGRKFKKHDEQIHVILNAIRQLLAPPEHPKKKIGF